MDNELSALSVIFTEFYYWVTVVLMFLIHVGFCKNVLPRAVVGAQGEGTVISVGGRKILVQIHHQAAIEVIYVDGLVILKAEHAHVGASLIPTGLR